MGDLILPAGIDVCNKPYRRLEAKHHVYRGCPGIFIIPSIRTGTSLAIGAALFYGGIVQILAGMWEFKKNNTIAATIFTSYGGSS